MHCADVADVVVAAGGREHAIEVLEANGAVVLALIVRAVVELLMVNASYIGSIEFSDYF